MNASYVVMLGVTKLPSTQSVVGARIYEDSILWFPRLMSNQGSFIQRPNTWSKTLLQNGHLDYHGLSWITCLKQAFVCVTLGIIGILLDFSGLPFCFVSQQGVAADHLGPLPTKTPI